MVRFADDQVIVARLTEGSVDRGHRAKAMVNAVRRHQTACNHTATHLAPQRPALVLVDVHPSGRRAHGAFPRDKLRFDFTVRRAVRRTSCGRSRNWSTGAS